MADQSIDSTGYLYDVWVANYGSNTVSKIVNGVKTGTDITVGTNPYGICVDRDNVIWVANYDSNTVSKIVNGVKTGTDIAVGSSPRGICVDRDNVIWVANYSSNTVSKIVNGVKTGTDIAVGSSPRGVCVDRDNVIWVANYDSNTVSKIVNGVKTGTDIAVGSSPCGICVDKDNVVWVVNYDSYTVSKIVNGVKTGTDITVGTNPYGICVDKDNVIWVANYGPNTVSKIVNGVKVGTDIAVGSSPYSLGDATGIQAAMLFGWGNEGIAAIINSDTQRKIAKTISINSDTARKIGGTISVDINSDTSRKVANMVNINSNTYRKTIITASIKFDSQRNISSEISILSDTARKIGGQISVTINADADRKISANISINFDTARSIAIETISVSTHSDTCRKIAIGVNIKSDTNRKIAQNLTSGTSDIGIKSISIQTGVQSLSDRFILETVGTAFSDIDNFTGEVAGFNFSFEKAETRESISPMGTTCTVTGRPDMNNFLFSSVYKTYGSSLYNGGRIISATAKSLCTAIGVDARNITDFIPLGIGSYDDDTKTFKIKEKSKKAFLDKLFGWTSEFAHRQIYYTNRNGQVVVNEVGRYTTIYNLNDASKYRIENMNIQRQRIRKFVDVSDSSNDNPSKPTKGKSVMEINYTNSPFSGSASFGESSLSYSGGLLMRETTSESVTTYAYEPANSYAFNSSKNVLKSKMTLSSDGNKRSTTTYEYDIAMHGPYESSDVDVSLTSEYTIVETKADGAWTVDTEHKTYHVPLGNGFFGQRVVEISDGDHVTVANSISRGSPGGLASMYTVKQYAGYTITHPEEVELPKDFIGELRYPVNIPVAQINIVNDLIGIINDMDNKIEEIISVSIILKPGIPLVDAVEGALTYKGNLYYIQTASATINDRGTRQQINAIRWY